MIESKENILVAIISQIKNIVEAEYRNNNSSNEDEYKTWRTSLKNLSRGLCMLDDVGTDPLKRDCWHDPDYILQEGLKNASCGLELERNFNEFIKCSLNLLGASPKAFLIIFDDIDTNFIKGWAVLETVRKYLTSPNLVVVISGDFKLYSLLVRKHQWVNLGDELIANEDENKKLGRLVDQLEEQYLMKVLRPENRIQLHGLKYYYDKKGGPDIEVKFNNDSKSEHLNKVLAGICNSLWGVSSKDFAGRLYINWILEQPMRTIVEIMHAYDECVFSDINNNNHANREFCLRFSFIFLTSLYHYGYNQDDVNKILDSNRVDIVDLIIKLVELDMFKDNLRLFPNTRDAQKNIFISIINALYSNALLLDTRMIGDFFIKMGVIHEIYKNNYYSNQDNFSSKVLSYFHLERYVLSITVARLFTAEVISKVFNSNG